MNKDERYIQYEEGVTFIPKCEQCGQYVVADKNIFVNDQTGLSDKPNATCKKCGRTHMIFMGFI